MCCIEGSGGKWFCSLQWDRAGTLQKGVGKLCRNSQFPWKKPPNFQYNWCFRDSSLKPLVKLCSCPLMCFYQHAVSLEWRCLGKIMVTHSHFSRTGKMLPCRYSLALQPRERAVEAVHRQNCAQEGEKRRCSGCCSGCCSTSWWSALRQKGPFRHNPEGLWRCHNSQCPFRNSDNLSTPHPSLCSLKSETRLLLQADAP